jgi:hypothetical protein
MPLTVFRGVLERLGHQLEMSAPELTTQRASAVSEADDGVFAQALRSIGPVGHRHIVCTDSKLCAMPIAFVASVA